MKNYSERTIWQSAVIAKFKTVKMKRTTNNILIYHNNKLVASFNVASNQGFIL